jgi:hypothetical protein
LDQESSDTLLRVETAYLEVADALASSHVKYGACGPIEAYTSEIVSSVRQARYAFDGNRDMNKREGRKFTITKNTTEALKTTLALKDIMNMLDRRDVTTFEHALNRVVMWGPAPGAYGNMSFIRFSNKNKVTLGELKLLDEAPWYEWVETEAFFEVSMRGQRIIVSINANETRQEYILKMSYEWSKQWVLVPTETPDANPWTKGFTDFPSECEA